MSKNFASRAPILDFGAQILVLHADIPIVGTFSCGDEMIDKIEEQLEYLVQEKKMNSLVLKVHPFIEAYLKKGLWSQRWKWARKFHVRLKVLGVPSYYSYEYKFFNRFNREIEEE